jgi:transcriptional repressor NrdR
VKCPYCAGDNTRVIDTSHDQRGGIRRRRVCSTCDERFTTYERPILATPLLVKRDGTREEFSRDKLMAGIRMACTKRPVAAAEIERLVGEVESELQQMGKAEVSSRIVGDKVMHHLKQLDEVAYIRFAIVYLRLDDLEEIRTELERLLMGR